MSEARLNIEPNGIFYTTTTGVYLEVEVEYAAIGGVLGDWDIQNIFLCHTANSSAIDIFDLIEGDCVRWEALCKEVLDGLMAEIAISPRDRDA